MRTALPLIVPLRILRQRGYESSNVPEHFLRIADDQVVCAGEIYNTSLPSEGFEPACVPANPLAG